MPVVTFPPGRPLRRAQSETGDAPPRQDVAFTFELVQLTQAGPPRRGYEPSGDRIRPGVEPARLAVGLDGLRVEPGVVVVAGRERLLHHHRRERTVLGARLVLLVADGVPDLVIHHVLTVGPDVTLEWHRATHPPRLVDEHPGLVVLVDGVEARGLDRDVVTAAFAHGHRRGQRHAEVGLGLHRVVDAGERDLRVVRPTLWIAEGFADHAREGFVSTERIGVESVLHLDRVGERLHGALADLVRRTGHDVPGLGARLGEGPTVRQDPRGQVRVELRHALRRGSYDRGAPRVHGRRALHGSQTLGRDGRRRARAGHGLIEDDPRDDDEDRQRVGTPAVRRHETAEPALLPPLLMLVAVGPHPTRILRQRVALCA